MEEAGGTWSSKGRQAGLYGSVMHKPAPVYEPLLKLNVDTTGCVQPECTSLSLLHHRMGIS